MSLIAKAKYLLEKVALVKKKVDPLVAKYEEVKSMGLDKIAELGTQIQEVLTVIHEYDEQVNGLININPIGLDPNVTDQVKTLLLQPGNKIGPKGKNALLAAARNLDRVNKKLSDLKAKLIGYRNRAVTEVADMMESSLTGVSGIDIDIQVTAPDPVTGNGGAIIPVLTPKLIDESTALVDDTLTDPTTVVNSIVMTTGTAAAQTGTGIANGIVVT